MFIVGFYNLFFGFYNGEVYFGGGEGDVLSRCFSFVFRSVGFIWK